MPLDAAKLPYLIAAAWLVVTVLLTLAIANRARASHPLAGTLRATRNLLLPLILLYAILRWVLGVPAHQTTLRIVETLAWAAAIHVALSLAGSTLFRSEQGEGWRGRMPKLFFDIARALILLLGVCLVLGAVWGYDLSALVATLGVTSIVLGFALQETLGNLIAGIAVLFERPFQIGDWVKVGDTVGRVHEINWRSVRVRTRPSDLVVVPHSTIAKETITNYSRPTLAHAEYPVIGFSYDDAPNKVKRVLMKVALSTRGILAEPTPEVRVKAYADFAIEYQLRFMIEDFERQPAILDAFMTQLWYAARRNGLTIPFPTQTTYEHRIPYKEPAAPPTDKKDALVNVPVFVPLDRDELEEIGRDAVVQDFGRGERVVHQGDPGDALYVITQGSAVVSIRAEDGSEKEVARLARGEFFGEMALLTGEPRTASVSAADDLTVLVIYKEALAALLTRRPPLAEEIAEIVEARRQGLRAIRDMKELPQDKRAQIRAGAGEIVTRIKRFLGL